MAADNNDKVLHILSTWELWFVNLESNAELNEALNKFISKFPRLESLKLITVPLECYILKINVNNHKLLGSIQVNYAHDIEVFEEYWLPKVIEIDAPRLKRKGFHM